MSPVKEHPNTITKAQIQCPELWARNLLEVGEIIDGLTCSDIIMHVDFYMKMSVVQHKNYN